jgi:hypothetical protein
VKNTLGRLKRWSHAVEVFTLYGGGWGVGVGGGVHGLGGDPGLTETSHKENHLQHLTEWSSTKKIYIKSVAHLFYLHIAVCFSKKINKKVIKIINR